MSDGSNRKETIRLLNHITALTRIYNLVRTRYRHTEIALSTITVPTLSAISATCLTIQEYATDSDSEKSLGITSRTNVQIGLAWIALILNFLVIPVISIIVRALKLQEKANSFGNTLDKIRLLYNEINERYQKQEEISTIDLNEYKNKLQELYNSTPPVPVRDIRRIVREMNVDTITIRSIQQIGYQSVYKKTVASLSGSAEMTPIDPNILYELERGKNLYESEHKKSSSSHEDIV